MFSADQLHVHDNNRNLLRKAINWKEPTDNLTTSEAFNEWGLWFAQKKSAANYSMYQINETYYARVIVMI